MIKEYFKFQKWQFVHLNLQNRQSKEFKMQEENV